MKNRNKKIISKLSKNKILLCDGAWGTQLFEMGLKPGECPEQWNITNRDKVYEIAKSYVDAGSDIIETNSFGGTPINLKSHGLEDRAWELNKAAAEISREAAGDNIIVAGSIGPSGKMLLMGDVTEQELYESFSLQAQALEDGGVDAALIETMTASDEIAIAVKAVRENTNLEIIATATYNKTQSSEFRTYMGSTIKEMAGNPLKEGASIIGTNCGNGTDMMIEIVREIRKLYPDIPILVQPNAGIPQMVDDSLTYPESPEFMASRTKELIKAGTNIIGGCCGTTPDHIKAIAKSIR